MIKKTLRRSTLLLCAIAVAGLGACGGDESQDPLRKYQDQTVQWTACDPTMMGPDATSLVEAAIHQHGDRLRCSVVRAPLDWAHPEKGDIVIGVTRLAAGKPEARRGALLFNPGGPGADGLFLSTLMLVDAFAGSNADSPQGAMQLRLLNEYDIVGFSPRGTGMSTRLQCATNEISRSVDLTATGWGTPENILNASYNDRKTAEACLKDPITPHINTDATARDMDLLRSLAGDEKLNFVGASYGTWLGAWYASLFPERVGRMVLDSSMDFTASFEQASLAQPPALQRVLEKVLIPYAARHADYFHLGNADADVQAVITALSPRMQTVLGKALIDLSASRSAADTSLGIISGARGLDNVLKAVEPSNTEGVAQGLQEQIFDPDDAGRDAVRRMWAQMLYQDYLSTWVQPQNQPISLSTFQSVFWAVQCNDTAATTDFSTWAAVVQGLADDTPLFLPNNYRNICAFWGGPRVKKPDIAPLKALGVLFVQSQYDAQTSAEGASKFFAQLPKASRVYVSDDYQHGVFPYMDQCVDPVVTAYLLGETPKQRELVCAGKPLTQDALLLENVGVKRGEPEVYEDRKKAEKLINEFKRGRALAPPDTQVLLEHW
ncbi:alpha/beta fold hydrolase [Ottowia thiooxydans]|uniref:alpha/beta fold hydrolase n=1 Tax=Ottowia thiooxydans TaxID=219182 RepID=UPI00146B995A|nr:alpha/beta fold hydrolase [Ottowia thiooxydans]